MRASSLFCIGAIALLAGTACGTKNTGELIRPTDPTFNDARGGKQTPAVCHNVQAEGTPLIVDWEPEERGDLEVAMRQGVAVVHYDCKSIKLLPDCHPEGGYGFLGMNNKEQVIAIDNADQAQANLPAHGATIGASIKSGAALKIGLIMVGKKTTTLDALERSAVSNPKCEGATHFVQSATIGAFAMSSGSVGAVGAKATVGDLFGAGGVGASAESSSKHNVDNKDGDLEACKKNDVESTTAPKGCSALLRVRLLSIAEGAPAAPKAPAAAENKPDVVCPEGLVATSGKCAPKTAEAPHDCTIADTLDECTAQCEKGSGESCGMASLFYAIGMGVPAADPAKALEFAKKGCAKEDDSSCDSVADDLITKDKAKGITLYKNTCYNAYAPSCLSLGRIYVTDGEPSRGVRFFQRACDAGDSIGCMEAARLWAKGTTGFKADQAKATPLYGSACLDDLPLTDACYAAGLGYEKGTGVEVDLPRARVMFRRACERKHTPSCDRLKKLEK
jgi:hypothetical protein